MLAASTRRRGRRIQQTPVAVDLTPPAHNTARRTSLGGHVGVPICDGCIRVLRDLKQALASSKPKQQKDLKRPLFKARAPCLKLLGARPDLKTSRGHRGDPHPCSRKDCCGAGELGLFLLRHASATKYGGQLVARLNDWRIHELNLPPVERIKPGQSYDEYIADLDAKADAQQKAEQHPGVMSWARYAVLQETALMSETCALIDGMLQAEVEQNMAVEERPKLPMGLYDVQRRACALVTMTHERQFACSAGAASAAEPTTTYGSAATAVPRESSASAAAASCAVQQVAGAASAGGAAASAGAASDAFTTKRGGVALHVHQDMPAITGRTKKQRLTAVSGATHAALSNIHTTTSHTIA